MPRVLVALDRSELALHVVEHVARVVQQGEVVLCHVASIPPQLLEHPGAEDPERQRQLEHEAGEARRAYYAQLAGELERDLLEPAKRRLHERAPPGAEVSVQTRVLTEPHAQVTEVLLGQLEAGEYDALAVGWHERSPLAALLDGSVSSKLARRVRPVALWLVPWMAP